MTRRPIVAANWKMHKTHLEAIQDVQKLSYLLDKADADRVEVVICPPFTALRSVQTLVESDRLPYAVGAQDVHWEEKGAFTGEISAPNARDAGARAVLVGHSERRHTFGESDLEAGRKCAAAARAGLHPVLCVGETLEQRERGETNEVVLRQLRVGIELLEPPQVSTMLIAYEPVWAIGTGRTALPEDASAVHAIIRETLRPVAGTRASEPPILYGGSVNVRNAAALLQAPGVDGLLVGGASLDAEGWAKLIRT